MKSHQSKAINCLLLYFIFSSADRRRLSSGSHAPIFTVVMRSKQQNQQTKLLECHAFVCQTPENAIVIAATLYQCKFFLFKLFF